jgi:antitoxin StbD
MAEFASITDAKAKLPELVRRAAEEDVVLLRHSHPAAVLMSVARHAALMEHLDDLEDRLAVYESEGEPVTGLGALEAETAAKEAG